ncbi:unnamed protein product [Microthlaspi erraticum]|nr:unnamed protein product [Microthlaspi erraticum]
MQSKLVYVNDRFYCFNAVKGCLYSFHPSSRTWNFHHAYTLECPYKLPTKKSKSVEKSVYLAEKKGELFLMFTRGNRKPMFYKLVSLKWEKLNRTYQLDGLTFFVSFYNSELRTDLPWMRNNVYFSRYGNTRKYCLSYSFDERRYMPRKLWQKWLEHCPPYSLWIDPPMNVLDYLSKL